MKNKLIHIAATFSMLVSTPALALQIEDIEIPEQITQTASKQTLTLNGAGIRTKFIFNIYVGALYLSKNTKQVTQILNSTDSRRISMHFLYDKIEKEKMTNGWTDGFEDNLSDAQLTTLKSSIDKFNSAFTADTVKGDVVVIDFTGNKETIVTINNNEKTRISGADFQRAVLSIWLGESPADEDLKQAMLGIAEE